MHILAFVGFLRTLLFSFWFFFFFKQKTAYEMRISDWSSDVCSSDLCLARRLAGDAAQQSELSQGQSVRRADDGARAEFGDQDAAADLRSGLQSGTAATRAGRRRR